MPKLETSKPRTERPESIQLSLAKNVPSGVELTVTGIHFESDLAGGKKREPDVLYLPNLPVSERDETLGRFLAAWNSVEREVLFLIAASMNLPVNEARPIYALGLNIQQLVSLVSEQATGRFTKLQTDAVLNWLGSLKTSNTKRNRIIHADWKCAITIGVDENEAPALDSWEWLRVYTPSDQTERKELDNNTPKARGKYVRSLKDIEIARNELLALTAQVHAIDLPTIPRPRARR